eukprot:scaffold8119_cov444-Prasinococcus_capsulatus_cf.AAC.1
MKTYGKKAGKNNRVPKVRGLCASLWRVLLLALRPLVGQAAHQPKDEVSVNEYARQLDSITINNRKEGLVEATGIDQVVSAMDALSPGRIITYFVRRWEIHWPTDVCWPPSVQEKSEKVNIKAAYAAFEETELPRLKADKPGLTHSQQKEHLWKAWQKSPLNPTLVRWPWRPSLLEKNR